MSEPQNIFDRINDGIEGAEGSIITLINTLIPWTAPTLPAYITGTHLYADLGFPWFVAVLQAISVEFLGLSAITTAFDIMRHNKQQRADKNKLSILYAVGAYAGYLSIILVVNVVLGIPMREEYKVYAGLGATGLLTLISLPAFLITAVRQKQREIAQEIAQQADAKVQKSSATAQGTAQHKTAQHSTKRKFTYDDFERDQLARNGQGPIEWHEIMTTYERSRRTAYKWLEIFDEKHGVKE